MVEWLEGEWKVPGHRVEVEHFMCSPKNTNSMIFIAKYQCQEKMSAICAYWSYCFVSHVHHFFPAEDNSANRLRQLLTGQQIGRCGKPTVFSPRKIIYNSWFFPRLRSLNIVEQEGICCEYPRHSQNKVNGGSLWHSWKAQIWDVCVTAQVILNVSPFKTPNL